MCYLNRHIELWITDKEMIESVDDLIFSRSIRDTHGPHFELFDVRIASALNKIIQNSHFKKRPVWRNKKFMKRNVSFVEDSSLT